MTEHSLSRFLVTLFSAGLLIPAAGTGRAQAHNATYSSARGKTVGELVIDLRADDIRWNAEMAVDELRRRASEDTIPLLRQALDSADYQQRQMAAHVLRYTPGYVPDERMAEVTVEGLRDDSLPWDRNLRTCNFIWTASEGTSYLIDNPAIGTARLQDALFLGDRQQQLLAAFVLAATDRHREAEKIMEILGPHLKDDKVFGNAVLAAYGLGRLGERALPYLRTLAHSEDRQQSETALFIIEAIIDPPRTKAQSWERRSRQRISFTGLDPVGNMPWPAFGGF